MTAKDYARFAAQASELAKQIQPAKTKSAEDRFWDARQLIVYHLRTAASQAQRIADQIGPEEGVQK